VCTGRLCCKGPLVPGFVAWPCAPELSEAAPPQTRVISFGSHARGEAGKHSDLEFLVIEPEVENPALESVRLRGVPFIHDIAGLTKLCRAAGVPLPEEMDRVDQLTRYAVGLRYDDDTVHAVERETASRLALAGLISAPGVGRLRLSVARGWCAMLGGWGAAVG
jgi:hypothetical protein